MNQEEKFMKAAIREARKAEKIQEVPIGCVIVYENKIIARGYNRRNTDKNTLAHAELSAIKKASKKLGDWRLEGCTMYVTLEPCQMCAGAIVQSRMDRVVIGSMNPKAGCAGSVLNLLQIPAFNHQVDLEYGVLEEECSSMLSEFFRKLRETKRQQKQMVTGKLKAELLQILSFHSCNSNALNNLLLEEQIHNQYRHDRNHGSRHQQRVIRCIGSLKEIQHQRNRKGICLV